MHLHMKSELRTKCPIMRYRAAEECSTALYRISDMRLYGISDQKMPKIPVAEITTRPINTLTARISW